MNWEVISNDRSSLQEYRLIDDNECKVIIKYNPLHRSARITAGNHHRLFFFESAGSLSGKIVFKNEYGMEVGNLVHDKFHPEEGSIIIDAEKYRYDLHSSPVPELTIYDSNSQQPIVNCGIQAERQYLQSTVSRSAQSIDNNCYLLGLCWYLFLPTAKNTRLVNH
jgi:hypothetical protein